MTQRIIINPVTRISGFLEIEVQVENNIVTEARTKGFLFRGFEKMLLGRSPFDVVYFTERICGICSTAHATAAALVLEDALGFTVSEQGKILRDILHGCEFIQNHIRHFYQYTTPDFVRLPDIRPLYPVEHSDFRLPDSITTRIGQHYFESLEISRSAHEMLAVLGGKVPHNHGIFIGGITTQPTTDKIIKIKSLLQKINQFIVDKMMPDVYSIAEYYKDYFSIGKGYGNLLSYGIFNNYKSLGTLYVDPLVYFSDGRTEGFNPVNITEEIDYSWFSGGKNTYKPFENGNITDNMNKAGAYTWIKAARYKNLPFETGPLARQWLSGEYRHGISTMDRTVARALEAKKAAEVVGILLDNVVPGISLQSKYDVPDSAQGSGLVDTTRGSLGHWLKLENKVVSFYQIITPSVWNLSPHDNEGLNGVAEQALIGTTIKDTENPLELGRIIRSFDPCVSCATHVYCEGREIKCIEVNP
ncbi:MAG: nickel-dependent hydrogenase large subunit [Clostridia bacterium]|nr:nickel-dependent hydrogenase large subunit [Clostridia bacterium]